MILKFEKYKIKQKGKNCVVFLSDTKECEKSKREREKCAGNGTVLLQKQHSSGAVFLSTVLLYIVYRDDSNSYYCG